MIPITSENEWLAYLKDFPKWLLPSSKTVILSPHPDDETLGAGGLIFELRKHHIPVFIISVTDGENAYAHIHNLREIRRKEQNLALKRLGVLPDHIIRLSLNDGGVKEKEYALEQLILPFVDKSTYLIAPWIKDFHPDHESVGRVAVKIAKKTGAILYFYFFWTWHYATISSLKNLPLCQLPLNTKAINAKQDALNFYQSQLTSKNNEPILPPHILKPANRLFEVYSPYGL